MREGEEEWKEGENMGTRHSSPVRRRSKRRWWRSFWLEEELGSAGGLGREDEVDQEEWLVLVGWVCNSMREFLDRG